MYKMQVMIVALAITLVSAMFTNQAFATHKDKASISDRTAPTGQVYRVGDDVPVAVAPVVESSGPMSGEGVYAAKCAMCHAAGVAGAPKAGDSMAWVERIAQGEAMLIDHAINGYQGSAGYMPPKGGCADCSDEDIEAAVIHMLALVQ